MADYYYELKDSVVHKNCSKYYVAYNRVGDAMMAGGFHMTSLSDRIWKEEGEKITFIKHPEPDTTVDLKEFLWVKLSAEVYSG